MQFIAWRQHSCLLTDHACGSVHVFYIIDGVVAFAPSLLRCPFYRAGGESVGFVTFCGLNWKTQLCGRGARRSRSYSNGAGGYAA